MRDFQIEKENLKRVYERNLSDLEGEEVIYKQLPQNFIQEPLINIWEARKYVSVWFEKSEYDRNKPLNVKWFLNYIGQLDLLPIFRGEQMRFTPKETGEPMGNMLLEFDNGYVKLICFILLEDNQLIQLSCKLPNIDRRVLGDVLADYKEFRGGFSYSNSRFHSEALKDFKTIKHGRGSETRKHVFTVYNFGGLEALNKIYEGVI